MAPSCTPHGPPKLAFFFLAGDMCTAAALSSPPCCRTEDLRKLVESLGQALHHRVAKELCLGVAVSRFSFVSSQHC